MQGLIISIFAVTTIFIGSTKGNYLLVELESSEGNEGNLDRMRPSLRSLRNMESHIENGHTGTTAIVPLVEAASFINQKSDESHEETTTIGNRHCNKNMEY